MVAVKAPGFGERKTSYMEDIAILTGGQLVKDELGISLEKAGEEVLGTAAKVRGGGCTYTCLCVGVPHLSDRLYHQ